MKKLLLLCLAALLLLAGCSMNTAPTTGELCITISNSSSRNVTEGNYISSNVAYYNVIIWQNNEIYINDVITADGSIVKKSYLLRSGTNDISVSALNSSRETLATKEFTGVPVTPGVTVTEDIKFSDSDLKGCLVIDIQNMDTSGDLYAKVFKISDDPNHQLSDVDVTEEITSNEHSNIAGQNYIQLSSRYSSPYGISGGYYSVRIYNKVGDTFNYLNNLPVKIVHDNSYVSGYYKDGKLIFRPYLAFNSLSELESQSLVNIWFYNNVVLSSCKLIAVNGTSRWEFKGNVDGNPVVFNNFDLDNSETVNVNMMLEYSVAGDDDTYLYDIGNVTVKKSAPLAFSYTMNDQTVTDTRFPSDCNVQFSVKKEGSIEGPNLGDGYIVKWYIDDAEYYTGNNDSLSIQTSKFTSGDHKLKASVIYTATGVENVLEGSFTIDSTLAIPTVISVYPNYKTGIGYEVSLQSSEPVKLYLCDSNGDNKEYITTVNGRESKFIGIPNGYQYGRVNYYAAIPISKDPESVSASDIILGQLRGFGGDDYLPMGQLIDVSMAMPKEGVFTNHDKPHFIISGMNHFKEKIVRVEYNGFVTTLIDEEKTNLSYEIDDSSLRDGKHIFDVTFNVYDKQNDITPVASCTFNLSYLYFAKGIASIEMDKVYQAYVMKSEAVGTPESPMDLFVAEYRTLMLNQDESDASKGTYYLLTAYVDDGMYYSMTIGTGSYEVNNEDCTIHLECTEYTPSGYKPIEEGKTANIVAGEDGSEVIKIDDVEYILLNKEVNVPNKNNPIEGAWKLRTIAPTAELLNAAASKYLSVLPLPEGFNLIEFNEGEGISIDVNVSIEGNKFTAAVSVDADASALNDSVSLVEDFVPYAVLSGELIGSNNIVGVAGFSIPVALSTTTDGSVLNIHYSHDGLPVVISLERTETFDVPTVKGTYFTKDKVATMESALDMAKNLVGASADANDILEMFNQPTIFFDSNEDKISLTGYWKTDSSIPELDKGSISFLMGNSFFGNDKDYLVMMNYVKSDEYQKGAEVLYVSELFGNGYDRTNGYLTVNKIMSVSDSCVVLDVDYCVEGTTIIRRGTLKLTKQGDGMVNTMEFFVENNVPLYALLTFTANGEIKCNLKLDDVAEINMVVGHYSLQDDKIVIEVDTDTLTAAGVDLGELKARAGMVLTFANDEIMLFEKFDETGRPINFGLKLTDAE